MPGDGPDGGLSGDSIDQEAPATRVRSSRRPRFFAAPEGPSVVIVPPGGTHEAIAPLPVAALRLDPETVARLGRLGLRRVGDLTGMPRAALARRFGQRLVRRLDQALGAEPEPISPEPPPPRLAVRLTFPDPIGLEADVLAALDRLLPALSERLRAQGLAARRVRLDALPADGGTRAVTVGLARPSADPERIRPLLAMKVAEIEAGFGIDALRLEAVAVEGKGTRPAGLAFRRRSGAAGRPAKREGVGSEWSGSPEDAGGRTGPGRRRGGDAEPARSHRPKASREGTQSLDPASRAVVARGHGDAAWDRSAFDDLIGQIGARLGLEAIQRVHPAESHIPEKGHQILLVAWSEPARDWPRPSAKSPADGWCRPLLLWRPEIVTDAADRRVGSCPTHAIGAEGRAMGQEGSLLDGPEAGAPVRDAGSRDAPGPGASGGVAAWNPRGPEAIRPGVAVVGTDAPVPTAPPTHFRWRGRTLEATAASGVERIAPEWWFDDPEWRTGVRDYWSVTTREGEALWLFYAHGGLLSAGWFCHGAFA